MKRNWVKKFVEKNSSWIRLNYLGSLLLGWLWYRASLRVDPQLLPIAVWITIVILLLLISFVLNKLRDVSIKYLSDMKKYKKAFDSYESNLEDHARKAVIKATNEMVSEMEKSKNSTIQ